MTHNGAQVLSDLQVQELARRGCQLHVKDGKGRSTLHLAASRGRIDIVEYLWSKALELEDEDESGRTPLQLAAANGHADCVAFLIKKGAFINATDNASMSPLHMAALRGQLNVLQVICEHGDAKLHTQINDLGLTPLGMAALSGNDACTSYLIDKYPKENIPGCYYSVLHAACLSCKPSLVSLVLDKSPRINHSHNPCKVTPLHVAASTGSIVIVRQILEVYSAREELDSLDCRGNPPVSYVPAECPERQKILNLLGTKVGHKTLRSSESEIFAGNTGDNEQNFASLKLCDQRRKVKHWAALASNDPGLLKIISEFKQKDQISMKLERVRVLLQTLKVHEIYSHLRRDEEFQEDMRDPIVAQTVESLRKDPSKYEMYRDKIRIGSVLQKLKVAHGELKGIGEQKLILDRALVQSRTSEEGTNDEQERRILLDEIDSVYGEIESLCQGNPVDKTSEDDFQSHPPNISWISLMLRNIIVTAIIGLVALLVKKIPGRYLGFDLHE